MGVVADPGGGVAEQSAPQFSIELPGDHGSPTQGCFAAF